MARAVCRNTPDMSVLCVSPFTLQTDPSSGGGVLARRAPPALLQIARNASKALFQGVLTPRGKVDETEDEGGGEKKRIKKKLK